MRRLTLAATLAAALAVPATADAAFFPAEVIDGPNGDVVSVGDVDLSREGTGAVVYVKRIDEEVERFAAEAAAEGIVAAA